MSDDRSNWLGLGIIAFFGAVVANIVIPERRGLYGLFSATVVGVACGLTAGIAASAYEVHPGTQLIITFAMGMLSYRFLNSLFQPKRSNTNVTNNNYGHQQQNIGQDGGKAEWGYNLDDDESET